jgi:restriction endonuclease S subunit
MSINHVIDEKKGKKIDTELRTNEKMNVGDTIEYLSNNNLTYMKYLIVIDKNGEKTLKLVDSFCHLYSSLR